MLVEQVRRKMCTGTNYCKKCNKEINYGDAFERHVDLDQETFTCLICKKIFIEKKKIVKHLAYHKEVSSSDHCLLCTETAFSCEICSKKFSTKIGWELHLKNHGNPEKRRCEVCQKEVTLGTFRSHMKRHANDRKTFSCDICSKSFYEKNNMIRHKRLHQEEETTKATCELCHKEYPSKAKLIRHKKLLHEPRVKSTCPVCNKLVCRLKEHLLTHTDDPIMYSCDICDKKFTRKGSLTKHRKTHNDIKVIHSCEVCNKTFSTRRALKLHLTIHDASREKIQCPKCDKKVLDLNHHMKNHDETRIRKKFPCTECTKEFFSSVHLKRHFSSIHGNIKFTCDICTKQFTTKEYLIRHTSTHEDSGIRYPCKICSKELHSKRNLELHVKNVHAKDLKET